MAHGHKEVLLGTNAPNASPKARFHLPVAGPFELMLLGATICTVVNSMVGYLKVPLPALIQGRYLLQWIVVLCVLLARSRLRAAAFQPFGPPGQRQWLILRGVFYYAFIWLWWSTLTLVPVGDAVAVVKCEVFVTGIMSSFLFGEKLTIRWWLCCFAAVTGVILLVRPPSIFGGSDSASMMGRLLNVLTPLVAGCMPCMIKLAPDAHFLEVQHACDFIAGIVMSPLVMLATGGSASLLLPRTVESIFGVAILGLVALSAFTLAYQRGEAGRVALVGYAEVPIAYLSQVVIFGAAVEPLAMAGAVLVVLSASGAATEIRRRHQSIENAEADFRRMPSI